MDTRAALAAFDEQVRRQPGRGPASGQIEQEPGIFRRVPDEDGGGWAGVMWSDLDAATADGVIAAQVERMSRHGRGWEWKYYSYDQPSDLPERLRAAGFEEEPQEALLVAEIADLPLDVRPPAGVELVPVVDERGVHAMASVHDEVFDRQHGDLAGQVLAAVSGEAPAGAAVVAVAEGLPICAGRVEFHEGSEFASLWGGGTVAAWRGRGVFRSVVAWRAALAAQRGFRYLQVDASDDSRPILKRLGFVQLATTTPFTRPGTHD